jgi:hypothetical protein
LTERRATISREDEDDPGCDIAPIGSVGPADLFADGDRRVMTANVERIAAPAVKPNAVSHVTGWLRRRMARWMTPKGPDYMASGSYRYLARHIHTDLPGRDGGRTILISATADVAANNDAILMLSYFLRDELGCRILLIDGTFRGEGVGAVLGHGDERGFFDLAYGDERTIADVAQPTRNRDIFVVPAGRSPGAGLPPIQPERIARLFRDARANFDYILLQQGRIFEDSRYLVFTGQADLILMMVDEGETQLREMEQCMSVFRDHQISDVRIVLSTPR